VPKVSICICNIQVRKYDPKFNLNLKLDVKIEQKQVRAIYNSVPEGNKIINDQYILGSQIKVRTPYRDLLAVADLPTVTFPFPSPLYHQRLSHNLSPDHPDVDTKGTEDSYRSLC
jgi:hypothetical protein